MQFIVVQRLQKISAANNYVCPSTWMGFAAAPMKRKKMVSI